MAAYNGSYVGNKLRSLTGQACMASPTAQEEGNRAPLTKLFLGIGVLTNEQKQKLNQQTICKHPSIPVLLRSIRIIGFDGTEAYEINKNNYKQKAAGGTVGTVLIVLELEPAVLP